MSTEISPRSFVFAERPNPHPGLLRPKTIFVEQLENGEAGLSISISPGFCRGEEEIKAYLGGKAAAKYKELIEKGSELYYGIMGEFDRSLSEKFGFEGELGICPLGTNYVPNPSHWKADRAASADQCLRAFANRLKWDNDVPPRVEVHWLSQEIKEPVASD